MNNEMELARKAAERGTLLNTLKQDYLSAMTSVRSLRGALDLQRISLSREDLAFHLVYLSDEGYVQIWRAREMPRFRPGAGISADEIVFAKLTGKGLRLIDGDCEEDPKVTF